MDLRVLKGIIDSAMDAIITVDAEQRIVLFNAAAELMFRCQASDAIGQSIEKFIPQRFRADHEHHIHRFGKTKETKRSMGALGAIYGLRTDGEEFPLEASISHTSSDEKRYFTVILRDITSRKRTEDALVKSENRYRSLIEFSPDAIFTWDLQGGIEYWNKAAEDLYGWTKDEAKGKISHELLKTKYPTSLPDVIDALERTGYWAGELLHKTREGDNTVVESRHVLIEGEEGRPLVLETNRDVTSRKRIEEQLRKQAELLDQARDAITLRDMQDRIVYWNKGAERIYGWRADEVTGTDIRQLLYRNKLSEFASAKRLLLETGEWVGEVEQVMRNEKTIITQGRWTLLRNDDGEAEAVLAINTDITEKKKLESQFLRAQRMESIGTLAGGIAHDINNILAPVLMAAQLLRLKVNNPDVRSMIDILETNAERGGDLVKQLLQFAKGVEGERIILQPKHLIKEIVKTLKETFPKSIQIGFSIGEDLFPVTGDATQIHQVLMNLCVNARDAIHGSGQIRIDATNVWIDENYAQMNLDTRAGQFALITVSDTGSGIPEEVKEKIFEPFFTTKERGKGTGLGLSTVLTIVKSHGGFVNVYSEAGRGTEFRVYLPSAAGSDEMQSQEEIAQLPSGQGELILVVDDEAAIRQITKNTLESFGYKVLTAGDGTEALALFAQHREAIEVVVTDMSMPYLDGPATIRALRKLDPHSKIIAVSGLTENKRALEADMKVSEFLIKPYKAEDLLEALAKILRTGP
jgi:PAS domain S-box-containing protein